MPDATCAHSMRFSSTEIGTMTPKHILFATDLSARCDRALERAALLAQSWQAELSILHVVEPLSSDQLIRELPSTRRMEERVSEARREILEGMPSTDLTFSIAVEEGEPAAVVLRVAQEKLVDMIVVGVAHYEPWGRMVMGSTVDALARRANIPILVAKTRAKRPYAQVVVATDFSAASQRALETASEFLPDAHITLFHAYHAPHATLADPQHSHGAWKEVAEKECRELVAAANLTDERRRTLGVVIEEGRPTPLLSQYVRSHGVNLIVIGARGHNALVQFFIGSNAENILNGVPSDVLVVPAEQ